MATVEESIEVRVPVSIAYDRWTQFEEFPQFMESVQEVHQLDDRHLRWVAEIDGEREEWEAEIVDQRPDQRIAWRSVSGATNEGIVTFDRLDADTTRVRVRMEWEPSGMAQRAGATLGRDGGMVADDLARFKELVEAHGAERGGWRGEIGPEAR